MVTASFNIYLLLADAFCYPVPGHLTTLEKGLEYLEAGTKHEFLAAFVKDICRLSLGEWEELYTRTLDLNPPAAPYIGYQIWGESYQRGTFLSKMNRELALNNIDLQGELPDHLIPVLRYLGRASKPLPELVEVFEQAVQQITVGLSSVDPDNPYLHLLKAMHSLSKDLKKEPA